MKSAGNSRRFSVATDFCAFNPYIDVHNSGTHIPSPSSAAQPFSHMRRTTWEHRGCTTSVSPNCLRSVRPSLLQLRFFLCFPCHVSFLGSSSCFPCGLCVFLRFVDHVGNVADSGASIQYSYSHIWLPSCLERFQTKKHFLCRLRASCISIPVRQAAITRR